MQQSEFFDYLCILPIKENSLDLFLYELPSIFIFFAINFVYTEEPSNKEELAHT